MDTNYAVFLVLGFLAVFMLLEGFFLLWSDAGTSEIKRVRERLYLLATVDRPQALPALVRERKFSKIAGLHAWLAKVPQIQVLDGLLLHAGAEQTVADLLARVLIGLVLGSFAYAISSGKFRWEGFASMEDLRTQLIGAVLMGFGGVTARGCSIGQGISGLSLLSAGSVLAVAGIVAGVWVATRIQAWQVERA